LRSRGNSREVTLATKRSARGIGGMQSV